MIKINFKLKTYKRGSTMKCTICKEEVILVPSAVARAKKFGGVPKDYTELFPTHTRCAVKKRNESVEKLMRKLNSKNL
jgi:hypothetical protein